MKWDLSLQDRLERRLRAIYGPAGSDVLPSLLQLLARYGDMPRSPRIERWDERDVVLITYGDQICEEGSSPLATLGRFLHEHRWLDLINTVHILPFYPHTSDDGFSVVDYLQVDPQLGSWEDIDQLRRHGDLIFDLVLNHVSQACVWFQRYLAGDPAYRDYFIEVEPETDLSSVTRPRSLPLLTPFTTRDGPRHVWTTFSADQVDLNYANPAVLLEILNVLLCYIQRGARFVRLDAVGYLWKELSTSCIHLPQAHEIVKLMRDVVDIMAPHVVLLTETNVPHRENISYFGDGDEAHMVYQFSLPPLLAEALLSQDGAALTRWLSQLEASQPGTTFFNFTASHDGVGVRPLEGILSPPQRAALVRAARERGALVSTKRNPDGTDSPYELNVTYLDLLWDPDPRHHRASFLASQAIMLSLRGIPGIYFHSLVGTLNDTQAASTSGIARRINRRKFRRDQLEADLSRTDSRQRMIWDAYRHLLQVRRVQKAFHPEGGQQVYCLSDSAVLAYLRTAPDQQQHILVIANLSGTCRTVDLARTSLALPVWDLLSETGVASERVTLAPYQVMWLSNSQPSERADGIRRNGT